MAFSPSQLSKSQPTRVPGSRLYSEVEKLRQQAAKAREEYERLSKELGKDVASAATVPTKTFAEIQPTLKNLVNEADAKQKSQIWEDLKESKALKKFGSANLRSFPVSMGMLEQRVGLTSESLGLDESANAVSLDDFKYATVAVLAFSAVSGVASLALLPPNVGATFCYFFALLPILFLGIGSSAPQLIANVLAKMKGEGDASTGQVSRQERVCRHEAAHFCCGYWCGLPIQGYSVRDDVSYVEFGVKTDNRLSSTEVAALSVCALGGLVGEATKFGKAEGAGEDLLALQGIFQKSEEFIGSAAEQDLTRWAALTAGLLLRQNAEAYEKVVDAFQRQAPIEECIGILEGQ